MVRAMLKPGRVVTIYRDPITENDVEGEAILQENYMPKWKYPVLLENSVVVEWLEMWVIQFADDRNTTHKRQIRVRSSKTIDELHLESLLAKA